MSRGQAESKDHGKRPRGIKKQQITLRKSPRLQAIRQSQEQPSSKRKNIQEVQAPLSPPASNIFEKRKASQNIYNLHKTSGPLRKRKRHSPPTQDQPPFTAEKELHPEAATGTSRDSPNPLQYWVQTGRWRKEYFEQDSQVREDFERGKLPEESRQRNWLREDLTREPFQKMHAFTHIQKLLTRKKSSSLPRKQSQSTLQMFSDQGSKSSQYNNPDYQIRLELKGSYMRQSNLGITDTSRDFCRNLLEKEQTIPQDTLFRDDLFDATCESVQDRNEAIVVRDLTPLICPSAQVLRIYGAKHLSNLYETVNEGWNSMVEYEGTRPQPDYSVGFARSAFTQEQLDKLEPFVGKPGFKVIAYFMANTRMYFPFLTCEVKCGVGALNIADRQNAHSMSIALRALVALFREVKRERELDREILAFSISHDDRYVRIYGHYPVMEGDKTCFYRHPIHEFSFSAIDGKEKWTTYKFVKNVYDHHSVKLHKLICSGIDDLPADTNFDLSQSAYLSQSRPQSTQQSITDPMLGENESQSSFVASHRPTTSLTQATEPAFKKPKNKQARG